VRFDQFPEKKIMAVPLTPAKPPFPPFTRDSAMQKVRLAEDAWNTRDPAKVALAYAIDSRWRNRSEFINGRYDIIAFSLSQVEQGVGLRILRHTLLGDQIRICSDEQRRPFTRAGRCDSLSSRRYHWRLCNRDSFSKLTHVFSFVVIAH
jgi:hypothetical protein